jgi:pimeloyl-ACP methyl ester carboxylesterase
MSEPTRPIRQPVVDNDGSLVTRTVATPKSFKVRARVTVGSRKVIPVIFIPGIMGTNLRVRRDVPLPDGLDVRPGEPAWRPPNGTYDGWKESRKWSKRDPAQRQKILDAQLLEVDDTGELDYSNARLHPSVMRERGWGEIHAGSYGGLLVELQQSLDKTFWVNPQGQREVRSYWKKVMQCEPARWGARTIAPITEAELEKYAAYQYPVYAFGYNWLQSCATSAERLRRRIDAIKKFWKDRKHECEQVILITHSMGGLVARACAKMKSEAGAEADDIGGIIHAVMPALGAPVAYRRIACGTEGKNFTNGLADNIRSSAFAEIAGDTPEDTTPVMALAPGVLQLLPNQLYPQPWIVIKAVRIVNKQEQVRDLLKLPTGNPYDFYRDLDSWYRMINPQLADPAGKYKQHDDGVTKAIIKAINAAETFHTRTLCAGPATAAEAGTTPYYHPNTYAFYGADSALRAYGEIRWVTREPTAQNLVLTAANVRSAKGSASPDGGVREVSVEGTSLRFILWPQDAHGDETVPVQSGSGPAKYVKQIFATRGYRHQESFRNDDMLLLTRHLIVKMVQGFK